MSRYADGPSGSVREIGPMGKAWAFVLRFLVILACVSVVALAVPFIIVYTGCMLMVGRRASINIQKMINRKQISS